MKVFILDSFERFEAKIIDNEEIDIGQFCQLPLVTVGCPGRMQLREHPVSRGEQGVITGTNCRMPQRLGNMTLPVM